MRSRKTTGPHFCSMRPFILKGHERRDIIIKNGEEKEMPDNSYFQTAMDFYQNKEYEKALIWFHKAAQQEDVVAKYNLGIMYKKEEVLRAI